MNRDVFLCHATEDKQEVVRPLRDALVAAGISCWLDEAEIRWGDGLIDQVNAGLRDSRFVLVVLSTTFMAKPWPRRELASALSGEASSGNVRVLPLLVGVHRESEAILDQLPLLRDKLYLVWEGDAAPVVRAMRARLGRSGAASDHREHTVHVAPASAVYCGRCGAQPGQRSVCSGSHTAHQFSQGTQRDICRRCGETPGSRTVCTGSYTSHDFGPGMDKAFCDLCGATPGRRTVCTGSHTSHSFRAGTGHEFCHRCGAKPGSRSVCVGSNTGHAFASAPEKGGI